MALTLADQLTLGAIEAALENARGREDQRPALDVVVESLADLHAQGISSDPAQLILRDREALVSELEERQRANVTIRAYRCAIEDLLAWAHRRQRTADLFEEHAIIDYLEDYQQRCQPARATYLHRFVILRSFMGWVSRRHGTPDPFLALKPPRARRERNWLTRDEFLQILKGAEHPARDLAGIAERDRLVLLAIVMAGLGRYELMAARWADINLNTQPATLQIHAGPGRAPRTQPLPVQLRAELQRWHELRRLSRPVFGGDGDLTWVSRSRWSGIRRRAVVGGCSRILWV